VGVHLENALVVEWPDDGKIFVTSRIDGATGDGVDIQPVLAVRPVLSSIGPSFLVVKLVI
jgi:hypothetical protein